MKTSQKTKFISLCLAGALMLPAGTVFADDAADAAVFYQQASEAYQAEDYGRADELLARAFALDPDLIYQYNRVLANQANGDLKAALDILDTYQEQMAADPEARFTDVPAIRASLEEAYAKAEAKREAAALAAAEKKNANGAEVTPPGDTYPDDEDEFSTSRVLGWSLVGVGVAGLGAAALFGSKVLISDVDDRFACENAGKSGCYAEFGDDAAQDRQFEEDQNTWDTQNTLTWVSLGVGAAALIGGGVVLYLDSQYTGEGVFASSGDSNLEWAPYVSADGAGGTFKLSF
ncbi:hypothetical protein [Bradymonas sediminis]|uniref:Uncharacterized protein n=1 Tax=Bradymonas sediminis TaxID=1548548 RepID=A0A2Z4FMY6_9DELT|nr:hypothetical protein [Bradymonas sediminis]AWV90200.1 hypothetical protein DN745_12995 [Bradymonas sediminis]TDP75832.1 hypothetical protein DFR33_103179 [Bradymonas sediminis]